MYGFKILCEIWKVPCEISHKILNPYIAKFAFYEVLIFDELWYLKSYDILSLSETDPWQPFMIDHHFVRSRTVFFIGSDYFSSCPKGSVAQLCWSHPGVAQCKLTSQMEVAIIPTNTQPVIIENIAQGLGLLR